MKAFALGLVLKVRVLEVGNGLLIGGKTKKELAHPGKCARLTPAPLPSQERFANVNVRKINHKHSNTVTLH